MDIDEQLRDAGRRLEVVDPPQPEMVPLRERAVRSSRRRASAALVSLALVVGVGVVVAGSALIAEGDSETEVVAAPGEPAPRETPALVLGQDVLATDGGEVTVTVIGDEAEFRAFNPMVDVYRLDADGRHRLGRLYLDMITGGGATPEFDPSTEITYGPPQISLQPGETSEHRLTFPSLEPGDYEIEVLIYGSGVDLGDDGTWVAAEIVTATLTVAEPEPTGRRPPATGASSEPVVPR